MGGSSQVSRKNNVLKQISNSTMAIPKVIVDKHGDCKNLNEIVFQQKVGSARLEKSVSGPECRPT